jgi:hypothetical protein
MNPSIIFEQISKYEQREENRAREASGERDEIERALRQLSKEEARIIEAYRMGIISAAQLGQELEGLNNRKTAAESRKASLSALPAHTLTPQSVKKSVAEYCRLAAQRLKEFTLEERQRFLRLIVNSVIYEGERVRIRGIIPILEAGRNTLQRPVVDGGRRMVDAFRWFAATMIDHSAHNPVIEYQAQRLMIEGENLTDYISFELLRALPNKPFSILSKKGLDLVNCLVNEYPSDTLKELCIRVWRKHGVTVSVSHMARALKRMGLTTSRGRVGQDMQVMKRAA